MPRAPYFTPAFDAFVAPARARSRLWRLALGIAVIAVVYLALSAAVFGVVAAGWGISQAVVLAGDVAAATKPWPVLLLLATFGGMALGPVVAVRLVHGRPAGSLFGRGARVLRDFVLAALTVAAVYAVLSIPWAMTWQAQPGLDLSLWLKLLPLAVLGVLVQTMAEELVFRGYLMQQLAARFRSPLVWMVVPVVVFGLLHYDPRTNGGNTWTVIFVVGLFGLVAADLTRRTGSLGAAWGLHFANNALALLVLATSGGIDGLALYRTPYGIADGAAAGLLAGDVISLVVVWLVVSRLTAR